MYLFIDAETGGLDTEHNLLTLSAIVTDKDFHVVPVPVPWSEQDDVPGCLYLQIKSDQYVVSPGALSVNKIDLVRHTENGIDLEEAQQRFKYFLKAGLAATGKSRLVPAGHNVPFDLKFVWKFLMPENAWRDFCTHPALDTAVVARFFNAAGRISGGCSLVTLRERFGIETGSAHNAEVDNLATIELAKRFVAMVPPVR
jgi:DNA polymerase III epsilon subunit-like protein